MLASAVIAGNAASVGYVGYEDALSVDPADFTPTDPTTQMMVDFLQNAAQANDTANAPIDASAFGSALIDWGKKLADKFRIPPNTPRTPPSPNPNPQGPGAGPGGGPDSNSGDRNATLGLTLETQMNLTCNLWSAPDGNGGRYFVWKCK